jgi:hypothetical protein
MEKEKAVTIKYEPFKEVVVMECTKFPSPDDLSRFTNIIAGGKMAGLYWTDGVAFLYFPLSVNTELTAKALIEEGRVYWAFLSYALMPEFKPIIETKEKIQVPVLNMSTNPLFQKVAAWLKKQG